MKAVTIIVTGKVQGVFFRASAKEEAEKHSLKGFAQNQPDGSVYMEAEGESDRVDQFIAWCKIGPPRASVANVAVSETNEKGYSQFEIRR